MGDPPGAVLGSAHMGRCQLSRYPQRNYAALGYPEPPTDQRACASGQQKPLTGTHRVRSGVYPLAQELRRLGKPVPMFSRLID